MTLDKLIQLDKEINVALKEVPNFYTKHIDRSPLLHKYDKANEVFAFATYITFTQHRMKEYTSYQFNALALRCYELQECSDLKKQLEKLVQYGNNEQLRPSLKLVNEIYNKNKIEVEELKKKLKLNQLQIIDQKQNDLFI